MSIQQDDTTLPSPPVTGQLNSVVPPERRRVGLTRIVLCVVAFACYVVFGASSNIVGFILFVATLLSANLIDPTHLHWVDRFDTMLLRLSRRPWQLIARVPGLSLVHLPKVSRLLRRVVTVLLVVFAVFLAFQQPLTRAADGLRDQTCIRWNWSLLCRSGLGIDSVQTEEGNLVRIGLIRGPEDGGPFDLSPLQTDEREIEAKIFQENSTACAASTPHITIPVITFLSRSVADTSTSANIGIQDLQGAFLAQQEYNRNPTNQIRLCLVIANIGNSAPDTLKLTLEPVMKRVMLFARNDSTFAGIVGLPFSGSAVDGLNIRDQWQQQQLPIVSPSASSTELSNRENFWRIASPDDVQDKILVQFMIQAFQTKNQETAKIAILIDKNDSYSKSLGENAFKSIEDYEANVRPVEVPYSVNDINSVMKAANQAVYEEKARFIFFAGYVSDLIWLEQRMKEIQADIQDRGQDATLPIAILGGDGLYDLTRTIDQNTVLVFSTVYASPLPATDPLAMSYEKNFRRVLASGDISLLPPHVILSYDAMKAYTEALRRLAQNGQAPTLAHISETLSSITFTGAGGDQISFSSGEGQSNPRDKTVYILCTDRAGVLKLAAQFQPGSALDLKLSQMPECR